MPFVDLGGRGGTSAQWVAGEFQPALDVRKIATYTGGQRRLLDEARHLLVVEPIRTHILSLSRDTAKQRAMGEPKFRMSVTYSTIHIAKQAVNSFFDRYDYFDAIYFTTT